MKIVSIHQPGYLPWLGFDKKISNSIIDIYKTLLYRSPDPEGFNFFYQQIVNNQMSVQNVKDQIMKSSEYQFMYDGVPQRYKISLIDELSNN